MSDQNSIVIRPYEAADLEDVIACVRALQVFESTFEPRMKDPADIGSWFVEELLAQCAAKDGVILVAADSATVIGYACVLARVICDDPDEIAYEYSYLSDLAVNPELRGQGIGSRLLQACKAYCEDHGSNCLRINVLAGNEGAARLYRKSGFKDRVIELDMMLDRHSDGP